MPHKKKIAKPFIAGLVTLIVLSIPGTSRAEEPSASALLNYLANAAAKKALNAERKTESDIWIQWSSLYKRLASEVPNNMTAKQMAADNLSKYDNLVATERRGQYLKFYKAYAAFWKSIAAQLQLAKIPEERFPSVMLIGLIGGIGTPWENAESEASAAERQLQLDCKDLKRQISSIESQVKRVEDQLEEDRRRGYVSSVVDNQKSFLSWQLSNLRKAHSQKGCSRH